MGFRGKELSGETKKIAGQRAVEKIIKKWTIDKKDVLLAIITNKDFFQC